jgi:hypothetical protein
MLTDLMFVSFSILNIIKPAGKGHISVFKDDENNLIQKK